VIDTGAQKARKSIMITLIDEEAQINPSGVSEMHGPANTIRQISAPKERGRNRDPRNSA